MKLLTVDLGNTRCKLRTWEEDPRGAPRRLRSLDVESAAGIGAALAAWIAEGPRPDAAAVCSVAAPALEAEVVETLRGLVPGAVDARPDPGLSVRSPAPDQTGRDRLFAARAALDLAGGDAVVVDAGTALTVDAVRADGVFLGGAIAPGPDLLARSLVQGTARLPRVDLLPGACADVGALGRDTAAALRAGVVVGFRGAARELAERVAAEAGFRDAPVVLTGGARGFLLDPPVFRGPRTIEEPDLVHLGLLAALRDRLPVSARAASASVEPADEGGPAPP